MRIPPNTQIINNDAAAWKVLGTNCGVSKSVISYFGSSGEVPIICKKSLCSE